MHGRNSLRISRSRRDCAREMITILTANFILNATCCAFKNTESVVLILFCIYTARNI